MKTKTRKRISRSSQNNEIKILSEQIDLHFKETARSVFIIGRCLHRLKQLMPHKDFLNLIDARWSMSHMSAHRIITCYLTFKDQKSRALLAAKPSVLYICSTLDDANKVAALASGQKVDIGGVYKTVNQLTVADAKILKENSKVRKAKPNNKSENDRKLTLKIHEELATTFEKLDDIAKLLLRYTNEGIEIQKRDSLKDYLTLTIVSLQEILCLLA